MLTRRPGPTPPVGRSRAAGAAMDILREPSPALPSRGAAETASRRDPPRPTASDVRREPLLESSGRCDAAGAREPRRVALAAEAARAGAPAVGAIDARRAVPVPTEECLTASSRAATAVVPAARRAAPVPYDALRTGPAAGAKDTWRSRSDPAFGGEAPRVAHAVRRPRPDASSSPRCATAAARRRSEAAVGLAAPAGTAAPRRPLGGDTVRDVGAASVARRDSGATAAGRSSCGAATDARRPVDVLQRPSSPSSSSSGTASPHTTPVLADSTVLNPLSRATFPRGSETFGCGAVCSTARSTGTGLTTGIARGSSSGLPCTICAVGIPAGGTVATAASSSSTSSRGVVPRELFVRSRPRSHVRSLPLPSSLSRRPLMRFQMPDRGVPCADFCAAPDAASGAAPSSGFMAVVCVSGAVCARSSGIGGGDVTTAVAGRDGGTNVGGFCVATGLSLTSHA